MQYNYKIILCCFFCNIFLFNNVYFCTKFSKLFSAVSVIPVQFSVLHSASCKVKIITYNSHVYSLVPYIN